MFLGRVDLQGNILPLPYIDGWLIRAKQKGVQKVIVSPINFSKAPYIEGVEVIPLGTVKDLINYLKQAIINL